jgi:hypothetical protein
MERVNFEAPAAFEDLLFDQSVRITELLERLRLVMASVNADQFGFGIVDSQNPTTATTTSGRPLAVSVNVSSPTTIDINPGIAVAPNGERIVIPNLLQQIPLATLAGNARNVVYLEFVEVPSAETAFTHADTPVAVRVERPADPATYVKSMELADYLLIVPETMKLIVPLAIVSIEVATTGNLLVVDMGTEVLSSNRPWFTAVDLKHRHQLGSGTVTATNPHGMSISDLSATSGKTFFQLLLDNGMVVAKDKSMAKLPGTLCSETVLATSVITDVAGIITGLIGAKYFRLSRIPVALVACINSAANQDYALSRVVGTNICFFTPQEPWDGTNISIRASAV